MTGEPSWELQANVILYWQGLQNSGGPNWELQANVLRGKQRFGDNLGGGAGGGGAGAVVLKIWFQVSDENLIFSSLTFQLILLTTILAICYVLVWVIT